MNNWELIENKVNQDGCITSGDLAKYAKISRQAAHKQLVKLVKQKKLSCIGKTKSRKYVLYNEQLSRVVQSNEILLTNKINEDSVFKKYLIDHNLENLVSKNTLEIIQYAFTEMLNNVIDHSLSDKVNIKISADGENINFEILDYGIGVFNNIRKKYNLANNYAALELLLQGKKTTLPEKHSGEGIFFTSKIADIFKLESAELELIVDNRIGDFFVKEVKNFSGTKVFFQVRQYSKKQLKNIFMSYTDENYKFNKTVIHIKLAGKSYVSRSEAKRLLVGSEDFEQIIFDFAKVESIGQGFADEIFRVYQKMFPAKKLLYENCLPAVEFMIKRSLELRP